MDRTAVKVCTLQDQDEAFCPFLSPDERLRVLEELNRQGRILAGYPAACVLNREDVRRSAYRPYQNRAGYGII